MIKILTIKFIALMMMLCLISQTVSGVTEICVKKQAHISGHAITLADVAHIQCDSIEMKNRLAKIVVGNFTSQSKQKGISIKTINAGLNGGGITPLSVDIYGATICKVETVAASGAIFKANDGGKTIGITPQVMIASEQYNKSIEDIEKTISPVTGQPVLTVEDEIKRRVVFESGFPLDKLAFEWNDFNADLLKMPLEVGRYRFDASRTIDIGNISFRVTDLKSNRKNKKSITAKVYYLCDVVVANQNLKKDDVITEMNVSVSQVKILSKRDIGISDVMQVLNQQVRTTIRKGETLRFDKIKRLEVVQRGDIVKVQHSVGNIKMDFRGYAQSTGARGDVITVVSFYDKRQKNIARVKAPGVVVLLHGLDDEPIARNDSYRGRRY